MTNKSRTYLDEVADLKNLRAYIAKEIPDSNPDALVVAVMLDRVLQAQWKNVTSLGTIASEIGTLRHAVANIGKKPGTLPSKPLPPPKQSPPALQGCSGSVAAAAGGVSLPEIRCGFGERVRTCRPKLPGA